MNCRICNKEFENYKDLTKHLVKDHNFKTSRIYEYYNYSFETGNAICPICGKEFIMTERQIKGFKKDCSKSIGCCTSCSKSLIIITHGSPLANPDIYNKTKESLKKHYGVEHPAQAKEVMNKMKKTTLDRYGVENASQSEELQEKKKQTNLKKHGVEHAIGAKEVRDKAEETLMKKYGVKNAFQAEEIKKKIEEVHLKKRQVKHPMQSKESQENMKKTNLEKYGVEYPMQSKEIQENIKKKNLKEYGVEWKIQTFEVQKKKRDTMLQRYGVEYALQIPEVQENIKKKSLKKYNTEYFLQASEVREKGYKTNLEKYGVKYFCQHEDCYKNNYNRISKINKKFQELLNKNNIESELEFIIENSGYDLKVKNTLVEINPWFTHNSTVGTVFGNKRMMKPKESTYHMDKTNFAKEHGFNCIHVFDWDDWNKVIYLLQSKKKLQARKCEVREIKSKVAKEFLESYHLQGSTRQVKHAFGLYYENKLVEVMTFGKPRYNKNYEWELLRLCTLPEIIVIGGAGKVLKHFEKVVSPKSLISYCDFSKFNGEVYEKLGFKITDQSLPAIHWYNPKTKKHITDNLLRQRGFDQLHNTTFGKGTSNEELMREYGYVEIFDCGQLVFVKNYK